MKKNYSNITVSVIIPVFNTPSEFLKKSINSILEQSHSNFELIVINDGSNNLDTINVLDSFNNYNNFILLTNDRNLGVSESLNVGLSYSSGKYIFRMDADDISNKNRLKISINYMENNPNIDILGTNAIAIGSRLRLIRTPQNDDQVNFKLLYTSPLIHPTVVFRKSFINKHKINYNNVKSEDYDLWVRSIVNFNAIIKNIKYYSIKYRYHDLQQTSLYKMQINKSVYLSRELLLDYYGFESEEKRMFNKIIEHNYKNNLNSLDFDRALLFSIILKLRKNIKNIKIITGSLIFINFKILIRYKDFTRLKLIIYLVKIHYLGKN